MAKDVILTMEVGEDFSFSEDKVHQLYEEIIANTNVNGDAEEIQKRIEAAKHEIIVMKNKIGEVQKEIDASKDKIEKAMEIIANVDPDTIPPALYIHEDIRCCFAGYLLMETDIIEEILVPHTMERYTAYFHNSRLSSKEFLRCYNNNGIRKVVTHPDTEFFIDEKIDVDAVREEYEAQQRKKFMEKAFPNIVKHIQEKAIKAITDEIEQYREEMKGMLKQLDQLRDIRDVNIRKIYRTSNNRTSISWNTRNDKNIYPDAIQRNPNLFMNGIHGRKL